MKRTNEKRLINNLITGTHWLSVKKKVATASVISFSFFLLVSVFIFVGWIDIAVSLGFTTYPFELRILVPWQSLQRLYRNICTVIFFVLGNRKCRLQRPSLKNRNFYRLNLLMWLYMQSTNMIFAALFFTSKSVYVISDLVS